MIFITLSEAHDVLDDWYLISNSEFYNAVADLMGAISCSFQENLAKSCVGAPTWGNPVSATAMVVYEKKFS